MIGSRNRRYLFDTNGIFEDELHEPVIAIGIAILRSSGNGRAPVVDALHVDVAEGRPQHGTQKSPHIVDHGERPVLGTAN